MTQQGKQTWTGLGLLNFSAWIRQQGFLRIIYRVFPKGWRNRVSALLAARSGATVRFPRTEAWEQSLSNPPRMAAPMQATTAPDSPVGVNILGYIRGQFGLAESARLYAKALIEAGVQVRLYDIDLGLPHGWEDRSLDAWIGEDTSHAVSIIFVNPDFLQPALEKIGSERLRGKYLIACWFWELDRVPEDWLPAIAQVDEIMVATKFVQEAFERVTDKPVLRVPQPLGMQHPSPLQRSDFGLEEGKFIFLVSFDFHSWVARKNPYAAIDAFIKAFAHERDDVRLLIKSSNGFRHADQFRDLLNAAAKDRRVIVRDEVIDRAHVAALQRCCDAYVSLHRAEGFGLGLAECMALGKPVIGTAWSGNLDFMNEQNSCLVDYRLLPVARGEYPSAEGAHWAEPDVEQAAVFMRRLVDEAGFAARIGAVAAVDVAHSNSFAQAGQVLAARLASLSQAGEDEKRRIINNRRGVS